MAKININKMDGTRYKAHVKATQEEYNEAEKQAFQTVREKVKLDGFRKGKVPEHIVKQKYKEDITDKALNNLLQIVSRQIIQELDQPLYQFVNVSKMDQEKGAYSFDVLFDVNPIVDPGKMKGIYIMEDTAVISDEDIAKELRTIQKMFATTNLKDEGSTVSAGDLVTITQEKWFQGTPVESSENGIQVILGENQFNKEAETEIINKACKVGDEIKIQKSESFVDNDGKEETRVYDLIIKVHAIYSVLLPDLNDDLAQKYDSDIKTMADLKKYLHSMLMKRFSRKNISTEINRVIDEIAAVAKVSVPENYYQEKFAEYLHEHQDYFRNATADDKVRLEPVFEKDHQKRLVYDYFLKKSLSKSNVDDHRAAFFEYLDSSFDKRSQSMVKEMYDAMAEKKSLYRDALYILDGFMKNFHSHLMGIYFKSEGMVKKNKKVAYAEYFAEKQG